MGMVAQAYNPGYLEAEIGGSWSEASPGESVGLSEKKLKANGLNDRALAYKYEALISTQYCKRKKKKPFHINHSIMFMSFFPSHYSISKFQ
jgi:hypothetical protein